jgi:hypothetical protein
LGTQFVGTRFGAGSCPYAQRCHQVIEADQLFAPLVVVACGWAGVWGGQDRWVGHWL